MVALSVRSRTVPHLLDTDPYICLLKRENIVRSFLTHRYKLNSVCSFLTHRYKVKNTVRRNTRLSRLHWYGRCNNTAAGLGY
jgi:hypothetical protein